MDQYGGTTKTLLECAPRSNASGTIRVQPQYVGWNGGTSKFFSAAFRRERRLHHLEADPRELPSKLLLQLHEEGPHGPGVDWLIVGEAKLYLLGNVCELCQVTLDEVAYGLRLGQCCALFAWVLGSELRAKLWAVDRVEAPLVQVAFQATIRVHGVARIPRSEHVRHGNTLRRGQAFGHEQPDACSQRRRVVAAGGHQCARPGLQHVFLERVEIRPIAFVGQGPLQLLKEIHLVRNWGVPELHVPHLVVRRRFQTIGRSFALQPPPQLIQLGNVERYWRSIELIVQPSGHVDQVLIPIEEPDLEGSGVHKRAGPQEANCEQHQRHHGLLAIAQHVTTLRRR
mmetsp:Transcript_58876/g.164467  ORF Transcript_58876/g.164467 Transcript_58876/m.164467 type:complete len:341 (-) Transcript_58876:49-1071(-)